MLHLQYFNSVLQYFQSVVQTFPPANRGLSGGEKMRERSETSAGPRQVLWCTVIRNFGWNQTGFEIPVFCNPDNAPIAHVQIYWLLESLRAQVTKPNSGLPRPRFTWLKCHSLPWDAGACSIGFLPGAGRGLSPLSHFFTAWVTSVSREQTFQSVIQNFPSARQLTYYLILKVCCVIPVLSQFYKIFSQWYIIFIRLHNIFSPQ